MSETDELIRVALNDLVTAAPPTELGRLRARRQEVARRHCKIVRGTAVGATALVTAAIVSVALFGRNDDPEHVTLGPTASADHTSSSSSQASAPTSAAPNVATTLTDWISEQQRLGRSTGRQQGSNGTDARLVVADGPADSAYALVLPTGEAFPLPVMSDPADAIELATIGRRLAIVDQGVAAATIWLLDAAAGTWTRALEIPSPSSFKAVWRVTALDGQVVLAAQSIRASGQGQFVPDQFAGMVIHADLSTETMSPAPDGILYEVTSSVSSFALIMGHDNGAGNSAPLVQPWQYDATTNRWTAIPIPAWLDCGQPCIWEAPHELGDLTLEVAAGDEVVKRLPGGTIGAYAPSTRTWRRLGDSPLDLASPSVRAVDGQVVVLPMVNQVSGNTPGVVAVLDLAAGTWTTTTVPTVARSDTDYLLPDVRVSGASAIVQLRPATATLADYRPDLTYDTVTRQWRTPTADEEALWPSLLQSYQDTPLDKLLPRGGRR